MQDRTHARRRDKTRCMRVRDPRLANDADNKAVPCTNVGQSIRRTVVTLLDEERHHAGDEVQGARKR